jgi:hypothetical protein
MSTIIFHNKVTVTMSSAFLTPAARDSAAKVRDASTSIVQLWLLLQRFFAYYVALRRRKASVFFCVRCGAIEKLLLLIECALMHCVILSCAAV